MRGRTTASDSSIRWQWGRLATDAKGDFHLKLKVLVADTQYLFGDAFASTLQLEPDFKLVEEIPNTGLLCLEAAARHRPDVVIADYWLHGMGGPAVTMVMRKRLPDTTVILLGWLQLSTQLHGAIASGASGFLPKTTGVAEAIQLIRQAYHDNKIVFPEAMAHLVKPRELKEAKEAWNQLSKLTFREIEILRSLGSGLRTEALAGQLDLSPHTVNSYAGSIRRKLGVRTRGEAVALARRYEVIPAYPLSLLPSSDVWI